MARGFLMTRRLAPVFVHGGLHDWYDIQQQVEPVRNDISQDIFGFEIA